MESIQEAFSNIQGKAQDYLNSHSDLIWADESVTSNWDTHSASKSLEKDELETKTISKIPEEPPHLKMTETNTQTQYEGQKYKSIYFNEKPLDF